MYMEGISHNFIFGLILFIDVGCIGIPMSLIFWIQAYLSKDLTIGSKHFIPTDTLFLLKKDCKLCI